MVIAEDKTKRVLKFKDGIYTGDINDNVPHGRGVYVRNEGGSHDGYW